MDQCIVLGVWNQHMRFLKPISETTASQWRNWKVNFKRIIRQAWMDWRGGLDSDVARRIDHFLPKCKWCNTHCRITSESRQGDGVNTIDQPPNERGQQSEPAVINWWEQPNPSLNPQIALEVHPEGESVPMSADAHRNWRADGDIPLWVGRFLRRPNVNSLWKPW